jgi:gentisate 1,2-dioxygenase
MSGPVNARFVDDIEPTHGEFPPWPALLVTRAEIDEQIDRLASLQLPEGGRRRVLISHPDAPSNIPGFTPSVRVALEALLPGERSAPVSHLGAVIGFCIRGSGSAVAADREMPFDLHDVWSVPSLVPYQHVNDTDTLQVRLMYSHDALLEQMRVPLRGDGDLEAMSFESSPWPSDRDPLADETVVFDDPNATVRSYEALVDPRTSAQTPAVWHFAEVGPLLDPSNALGEAYDGRTVAVLAHSANDRNMGTTPTLSAMYGAIPPHVSHKPHLHTATSIVYHFGGSGHSVIGGRKVEWGAGDLMLGAPGLAVHFHGSGADVDWAMVVQDNALQLSMDTEVWQEDLRQPPILIGSHEGYRTNRASLQAASQ